MNDRFSPFLSSHLSFSMLLLLLGGGFFLSAETRTQRKAPSNSPDTGIFANGFFYGEDQYYVVTPPLIHVYYAPSAQFASTSERNATSTVSQAQSGYIHEIFVLVKGKWAKKYRQVSTKPDGYLTANSCDTANTLDLPGGLLRDALPRLIKIKAIEELRDRAVVVYTDTPDHDDYYSLKTALLERGSRSWHVASSVFSGDAVHFCGAQTFRVESSKGQESTVFLLYLGDVASGKTDASDFISIQSFLLREPAPFSRGLNN